ncbi:hypothetical protein HanIR_Chr09g0449781 [Helianthus annuus]|nr:hypothetical protein HanIR_Chr09g0449781 [Helianthus annuus]
MWHRKIWCWLYRCCFNCEKCFVFTSCSVSGMFVFPWCTGVSL